MTMLLTNNHRVFSPLNPARYFSTLGRSALLLLLLLSLTPAGHCASSAQPGPPVLRVGLDLWPGYYPLLIAAEKPFFDPAVVQVDYRIPENTAAMLEDFVEGELDIVCVALGDLFALLDRVPDSRVILIADLSAGGDALLSLRPLRSLPTNLRIGTNTDGFGALFVEQFMLDYRFTAEQITLTDMEASDAMDMLRQQEVDIAHTWEPYITEAVEQGARILFTSRQTPGLIPDVVIARGYLGKESPVALQHFVERWLQALNWWQTNPAAGNQLIQQAAPLAGPISMKGIKLMTLEDNLEAFGKPESPRYLPKAVDRYVDYFYRQGVLPRRLSSDEVISPAFLPSP